MALAVIAACTRGDAPSTDTARASSAGPDSSELATVPAVEPRQDSSQPAAAPREWKVNPRGIGPIAAGMTLDQANAATGNRLVLRPAMEECDFIRIRDWPDGPLIMVERGTISRIDIVRTSPITTEAGAKIGDTEARIEALYPGRVQVQPHKYTDGRYLVVTPSGTGEQAYRIVFETDGSKVLRYRSGRMPAVQYVEGCS